MDEENSYACQCGADNLHQVGLVNFYRTEDADEVSATWVNREGEIASTREESANSANPSPRRDGCIIVFECEQCDDLTGLSVWQHKGTTYQQLHVFPASEWGGHPLVLQFRRPSFIDLLTRGVVK